MSKKKSMERRERQMTLNIEKKNVEKKIDLERPLGKYEYINPKTSGKKRSFFS